MFFLLNLNMFHNFFYCVYCWLRTSKCKLGASFTLKNFQILQIFFVPSHDWAMDLGFRSRFLKKKFEKNVIGIFRRSIISHYLNHIELIFFIVCNCGKIIISWMTFKYIVLVPTFISICFYIAIIF